jgi:hypothetical protein
MERLGVNIERNGYSVLLRAFYHHTSDRVRAKHVRLVKGTGVTNLNCNLEQYWFQEYNLTNT